MYTTTHTYIIYTTLLEYSSLNFIIAVFFFFSDAFYIHVWSAVFLQLSFVAGVFIMLPWLQTLMNKPPIFWLFGFVFEKWTRVCEIVDEVTVKPV